MEEQKKHTLVKVATALSVVVFLLLVGLAGLGWAYEGRTLPALTIGTLEFGGKTDSEVRAMIEEQYKNAVEPGVQVSFDRGNGREQIIVAIPMKFDANAAAQNVAQYGREGNYLSRGWRVLLSYFGQAHVDLAGLSVTTQEIEASVLTALAPLERPAQNADFKVTNLEPLKYTITSSTPGVVFDYAGIGEKVLFRWQELLPAKVTVASTIDYPTVTEADVAAIASSTVAVFSSPVHLTYYDTHTKRPYQWTIKRQQIADWIDITRNNDQVIQVTLAAAPLDTYVSNTIKSVVDVPPLDAEFKVNSSTTKVTHFVGARPGVTVNLPATKQGLELVFSQRREGTMATSTPLIISKVEPKIKTEDTNNLGIKEILGTGVSNFSGSPRNRILNIKNAVNNKLNGTLVPPGAEFSLVKTLAPYTLASGYLPELVILGNRITPEIAGGLCQVGTTMFRAAMNSAMPITARTNHGLVVSYYNDPSNGNPGTDATIYDPAPDFRFKNDTGHYILITTSMNVNTGDLAFSLWGTSDGRKGYYTPPVVLSRSYPGEFETIETDDLPPGKKECQKAYPGVVATFNYIREMPGKDKEVREFRSSYRAVSARCFVGKDPNKPSCPEDDPNCVPPAEPSAPPVPLIE